MLALCALVTSALAQSPSELAHLATLPPLRVSIDGATLTGERELLPAMAGKNNTEQEELFRAAMRPIRMGESFQLTVKSADGATVTSSPTTKYAANGCLIVSPSGFVTITMSSSSCTMLDVSLIWVAIVGADKQTLAWNRYVFKMSQ